MEEENDLEIQVICSFKDAIKWFGIYVPLGEEICREYQNACLKMNIRLSHGLCNPCYQRETARMKADRRYEKFLEVSKRYFKC